MINGSFRLEMNSAGVVALLNSPEVTGEVKRLAEVFRAKLPGEWALDESKTDRVGYVVRASDKTARQHALENPGQVVAALGGRGA